MAYVNPGELRQQIQILTPRRTVDANGHMVKQDAHSMRLRAAVRAISIGRNEDSVEYGAARTVQQLQFIVRWRTDLNNDMVILWKGKRYEIESIDPTPFAGQYMRIRGVAYDEGTGE